jgi:hypothetical protein
MRVTRLAMIWSALFAGLVTAGFLTPIAVGRWAWIGACLLLALAVSGGRPWDGAKRREPEVLEEAPPDAEAWRREREHAAAKRGEETKQGAGTSGYL